MQRRQVLPGHFALDDLTKGRTGGPRHRGRNCGFQGEYIGWDHRESHALFHHDVRMGLPKKNGFLRCKASVFGFFPRICILMLFDCHM